MQPHHDHSGLFAICGAHTVRAVPSMRQRRQLPSPTFPNWRKIKVHTTYIAYIHLLHSRHSHPHTICYYRKTRVRSVACGSFCLCIHTNTLHSWIWAKYAIYSRYICVYRAQNTNYSHKILHYAHNEYKVTTNTTEIFFHTIPSVPLK